MKECRDIFLYRKRIEEHTKDKISSPRALGRKAEGALIAGIKDLIMELHYQHIYLSSAEVKRKKSTN